MTALPLLRPRCNSPPSGDVFKNYDYRTIVSGGAYSFSAASIRLPICINRWWAAISMKASSRGERGGNVCAFG